MARRPSVWTIYFPRFHCPNCKVVIKARYSGGQFRFDKVPRGRPAKPRDAVDRVLSTGPSTRSQNGTSEGDAGGSP